MNYTPTVMKNAITIKELYSLHYFKYCKRFDIPGEKHDFWEFLYVDAGEVNAVAENNTFRLKQGQAIFHKPLEFHNIYTEDRFANSIVVSFSSNSRLMKFFENKILTFSDYEKALLKAIIDEASIAYPDTLNEVWAESLGKNKSGVIGSDQIIRQNLELLLVSLIRSNDATKPIIKKQKENKRASEQCTKIVDDIKKIVEENLYSDFPLDEISSRLFFSKTYLKNVFKKETGTSINQYRINLRLDEAKRLISQNKYSFTEIAYRLNFTSVHYFSRVFKLHTGMTPTEYARLVGIEQILV